MKLMHRIWLVTALVLVMAMSVLGIFSYRLADTRVEEDVLKSARTLRDLLMTVRYTYHQRFLASGLPLTDQTLGFLPAHAMAGISDDFKRFHDMGIRFRNVSDRARNPANRADATEMETIEWFREHPDARERMVRVDGSDALGFFFYATPIRIEAYCLKCHGDPADAPATIRNRYDSGFGYKTGELRGILGIRLPAAAAEANVHGALAREQLAHLAGFFLALVVGGLLMQKLVVRRLREFKSGAISLAHGDYQARLHVTGPDEIAELTEAFNHMAAAIQIRDESLRQSHARLDLFREVLDHSQDALMILEADSGRFLGVNQQACHFLERARQALLAMSVTELPQLRLDADRWRRFVDQLKTRAEQLRTLDLPRPNTEPLPLEVSLKYHEADGRAYILAVARDHTERRRDESALRESETKFHTMVDWTYDWEYWANPDGSFHYITPSVERVTGYSAEEFERNPTLIDAIVHAEERHLWERHVHHHLSAGACEDIAELDFRIVRKQGDIRWVTHTCRPVCDKNLRYLGRRVTVRDITARKEAEEQIRHLAYFDPLTGLPNRRLLMDRLGQALIAGNRSQEHGALLILDLDHFKSLNDTRGHECGDRLLVEVARRLRACVRQEDTVVRLGGDEFVVMAEDLGVDEASAALQAETVAEKIHRSLNEPYALDGMDREHHSTPSIGLTLFRGLDTSADVLLKQADVALYQAKDAGRNTSRFFNPAMQATIDARAAMENALRKGLREREFHLFYQPQMDQDGRLIGAEALLRWLPPGQGPVSPASFIPLAEETGLILPLGQWVVDTACAQIKDWEAVPATRELRLAINVSARQFHQPDFVARIRDSLAHSGANPSRLKLELTESVVLSNIDEVVLRMEQLRSLGVGFSLDDFGTGYSSLSYLKRLPLDQLKIDQSFVRDIPRDANDAAIVRAILAMSQSLGLHVIAEGVETLEQRDFLRDNGCTAYQGYLFGKPMPIGEWGAML